MSFPEGGRGPLRTIELTTPFTFEVANTELDFGNVAEAEAPESGDFDAQYQDLGYALSALDRVTAAESMTLTLEAPDEGSFDDFYYVALDLSADGLSPQRVAREYYPSGTTATLDIDTYYARDFIRQPGFRATLVLDPEYYSDFPGEEDYRFRAEFGALYSFYDGDPAPAEVTFEREVNVRRWLQDVEDIDVGDIVSAQVSEVLVYERLYSDSDSLRERLEAARIRVGSPETEETEEVAVLRTFEEEEDPYYGSYAVMKAEADMDVTATVRRTGRLLVEGTYELDEAAARRGERYETDVVVAVTFEIPIPTSEGVEEDLRRLTLRIPMAEVAAPVE